MLTNKGTFYLKISCSNSILKEIVDELGTKAKVNRTVVTGAISPSS